MMTIILKLIAPLAAGITAMIPIYSDRNNKSARYLYTMSILVVIIWIVTSAILISDYNDSKKAYSEEQRQTGLLNQIRAAQGDEEILKNYVTAQRVVIDKLAGQSSQDFIDELRETLHEKKEKRNELNKVSEKLSAEYQVRMIPFQDFILAQIDRRMDALEQDGIISKIEKAPQSESPVVVVDKLSKYKHIRHYKFIDGSDLFVRQSPLLIHSGKTSGSLEIILHFQRPEFYDETLLKFDIYPNKSIIQNGKKGVLGFSDYSSETNPMSDKQLLDNAVEAINKSILYSIIEIDADKK